MSSPAAARAEARRKAILSRGADRLSKLTTSARGEDAPAYMHDDPPLQALPKATNLEQFVGEESAMPTPPARSQTAARDAHSSPFANFGIPPGSSDPSLWSEEQQARLLNALMAGAASQTRARSAEPQVPSLEDSGNVGNQTLPDDNPFAALMAMMPPPGSQDGAGGGIPPGMFPPGNMFAPPPAAAPAQRTLLQKAMPLIHLVAGWMLLTYFVIWKEAQVYDAQPHAASSDSRWRRWAELNWKAPNDSFGVQFVPFFWAFTTLTLVLHTWRIFMGLDPVQPHMLVSLALPHLPPPIPSLVLNGMKYLQIGSVFLDDIAVLLFGIGLIIWVSSWFVN